MKIREKQHVHLARELEPVREAEAVREAEPVDHFDREVHIPRNERPVRFDEPRAVFSGERRDAEDAISALDWIGSEMDLSDLRDGFEDRRFAAIAAENELARQEGVERTAQEGGAPLDLSRIGSGLNPNAIPPQLYWDEEMVNRCVSDGLARGGLTNEAHDENGRIGQEIYRPREDHAPAPEVNAADLAVLVHETGVDLTKVDPNQLVAAARYVNAATEDEQRAERLQKTLSSFRVLTTTGAPQLDANLMREKLWQIARVPGHAIQDMPPAKLNEVYQQVVAATNGGPGESQIKIDKYNLKMTVNDQGTVTKSECKKPGFFSRLGSVFRVVLNVASLIPSPIQPFAAIANGVVNAVRAARDGSVLGFISAAAGAVGAGFARFGGSALAGAARAARSVSSIARGVEQVERGGFGSIVTGAAGIAAGLAGFAGDRLAGAADGLQRLATRLQPIASYQEYRGASRAVSEAEHALEEAQASGDQRSIAEAQHMLDETRRNQRSALLSTMGSVAGAAGTFSAQGSTFNRAANVAGRAFDVARGVNDHDYLSAAAGALGAVNAVHGEREGFDWLNAASHAADAGNGYRLAAGAEHAADAAVHRAEQDLAAARRTGDADLIRAAEDALRSARRARGSAIAGTSLAQQSFGDTLAGTVQQYRQSHEPEPEPEHAPDSAAIDDEQRRREEGAESLKNGADRAAEELAAILEDDRATGGFATMAEESIEDLENKKGALDLAVASGDLDRIHRAADALEDARVDAVSRAETLRNVFRPIAVEPAPLADLPATVDYRVRAGDRLELIAARNGLSVEELFAVNPGIDPRRMRVGQTINLPTESHDLAGRDALRTSRENAAHMVDTGDANYTVQAGDTLNALAARYGGSVEELLRINPQLARDGTVYRNQRLNVPGATPPPPPAMPQLDPQALIRAGLSANQEVGDARQTESDQHAGLWGGFFNPMAAANVLSDREGREHARSEYQEAAGAMIRAGANPSATEEERRAALDRFLNGRAEFAHQEGLVQDARTSANYLSVVTYAAREGNALANRATDRAADQITAAAYEHLPEPLAHAVDTFEHGWARAQRQVNDLNFGTVEGFNDQVSNLAGLTSDLLTHPIDTVEHVGAGLGAVIDRGFQATPQGRAFQLAVNAAMGSYSSFDEFSRDADRMMDTRDILRAGGSFVYDMGNAMFSGASDAFANGDIGRGLGLVGGNLINPLEVVQALRGAGFASRAELLEDAARLGESSLPRAVGASDGTFLRARLAGYPDSPAFYAAMGRAIDDAALELRTATSRGLVTADDVDATLSRIGRQHPGVGPGSKYGRPLDNSLEGRMIDRINEIERHRSQFPRAAEAMDQFFATGNPDFLRERLVFPIDGVPTELELSTVQSGALFGFDDLVTAHPANYVARQLSREGYEIVAGVINDSSLTEAQAMERLGRAHYLFMHGTPFENGSPAAVEAMMDAVMRNKYGVTFTPKRVGIEPFWEAMFNRTGIDDYARRFRSFFE